MFEPPVTLIESKKQKTVFEDVDGSKVIAYLEKDSPGMAVNILLAFHSIHSVKEARDANKENRQLEELF